MPTLTKGALALSCCALDIPYVLRFDGLVPYRHVLRHARANWSGSRGISAAARNVAAERSRRDADGGRGSIAKARLAGYSAPTRRDPAKKPMLRDRRDIAARFS